MGIRFNRKGGSRHDVQQHHHRRAALHGRFRGEIENADRHRLSAFRAIVTLPGIHATQINAFVEWLVGQQLPAGFPQTDAEKERAARDDAVALAIEDHTVLIRPDPENVPLAFRADKFLQTFVSKRRIKFLNVLNEKVRDAVKRRGECWRIAPLPMSPTEMQERISASRIGIRGKEIYYYNSTTGTRWLTCQEFSRLGGLDELSFGGTSSRSASSPRVESPWPPGDRLLHGGRLFPPRCPCPLRFRPA